MVVEGSLPAASFWATWSENMEVWSIDDDTLWDFGGVTEITLKLRDPYNQFDEMVLTLSGGDIVLPSDGIIQWRVEAVAMGTLQAKLYEVIILVESDGDTIPFFLGPLSVIG